LLVQKVTKKDTTPKNTAILLSHYLTALIAMQNLVFTPGVDMPSHLFKEIKQNRFLRSLSLRGPVSKRHAGVCLCQT
jgi:hypothetical protein